VHLWETFSRGEGAPMVGEHHTWRRAHFEREGANFKGKGKGHSSIQVGKRSSNLSVKGKLKAKDQDKEKQARGRKAHQGKGRLTLQGLWESLRGTPRHQRVVAIVLGSLVYVSCVVHFALRPSIYICSKLVFPMEGFF
jgi:hypothetical protein